MAWFWLNVPLMALCLGAWAGIPLFLTLTRWHAELNAKNAALAAQAAAVPVIAQSAPAMAAARETAGPVYAGVANGPGR